MFINKTSHTTSIVNELFKNIKSLKYIVTKYTTDAMILDAVKNDVSQIAYIQVDYKISSELVSKLHNSGMLLNLNSKIKINNKQLSDGLISISEMYLFNTKYDNLNLSQIKKLIQISNNYNIPINVGQIIDSRKYIEVDNPNDPYEYYCAKVEDLEYLVNYCITNSVKLKLSEYFIIEYVVSKFPNAIKLLQDTWIPERVFSEYYKPVYINDKNFNNTCSLVSNYGQSNERYCCKDPQVFSRNDTLNNNIFRVEPTSNFKVIGNNLLFSHFCVKE
jgi:hypothetical protein